MSLCSAIATATLFCLSLSAALAQQPPQRESSGVKLRTCFQSLIEGEWQANFYLAQVNHGFSCPIGISPDGTLGFGNCITAKNMTIVQPPSGILTIDRNCHVVGSITYGFSDDQWGGGVAQESFSCGALRMEAGCQERGISFAATKSAEFPKIGLFRLSWSQANDEACASSNGRASAGAFVCKLRGDKLNRLSDSQIPGAEL